MINTILLTAIILAIPVFFIALFISSHIHATRKAKLNAKSLNEKSSTPD